MSNANVVIRLPVILLLLAITGCGQTKNDNTELDKGFVSLFNGKDLNNWDLKVKSGDVQEAAKVFQVDNGVVHVFKDHPDNYNLNMGNYTTHGMMYTKQKYSRFIFRFEYKWGTKKTNNFDAYQYDAGMYYHVFDDKIWPKGLEYQVRYDHTKDRNHTGDYWASNVKMQWFSNDGETFNAPWNGGVAQTQKGGEHRAKVNVKFNALNDQWNQAEVIVMGNEYSIHKLNGEIVNYATGFDQNEGVIGLQSETAEIFYRNIEIKELTESMPVEYFVQ